MNMGQPVNVCSGVRTRILFYLERDLHLPFLLPIHQQICRLCPDVETAFYAVPHSLPQNGVPGWGLDEQELQRLGEMVQLAETVEQFSPDITVFADACTNVHNWYNCGKRVFVGHGIISKGGFYTTNLLVRRDNLADLICVPGPWHKEILQQNVFTPIEVTGFIKSDRLFGEHACTREAFCQQYAIPQTAVIILYAPTFNEELSAIPCLGAQIAQVCEPDRYLIIKLHTMTDSSIVEQHRQLAAGHPRIRFVEEIDVTPAMAAADILISDVSSVLVEFMALNRPVVAVNNPRQQEYENYQADDIEYRVRDACLQVTDTTELLEAVVRSIRQPDELARQRMHYAEALCFGRDGHSAERAARSILDLANGVYAAVDNRACYTVLLKVGETDTPAQLLSSLGDLAVSNPGAQLEVVVWGMESLPGLSIPLVRAWLPASADLQTVLQTADACSPSPWLVLLETGIQLPERWLQFLSNYFRWEPELAMIRTLTARDDYPRILQVINPELINMPISEVSNLLLTTFMGRELPMWYAASGCCMIRRNDLPMLVNKLFYNEKIPYLELIRRYYDAHGYPCSQALDLFACPVPMKDSTVEELEQAVRAWEIGPGSPRLLNQLLSLLLGLNCTADARLVWTQSAGKNTGLQAVWGGLNSLSE